MPHDGLYARIDVGLIGDLQVVRKFLNLHVWLRLELKREIIMSVCGASLAHLLRHIRILIHIISNWKPISYIANLWRLNLFLILHVFLDHALMIFLALPIAWFQFPGGILRRGPLWWWPQIPCSEHERWYIVTHLDWNVGLNALLPKGLKLFLANPLRVLRNAHLVIVHMIVNILIHRAALKLPPDLPR